MNEAGPDAATVVGIGLSALVALGVALWKAASLRGDVNRAWNTRVDDVSAALTHRAIDELQALRRETDRLLGDPDEEDPPVLASVDPAPLVERARAVAKYSEARERIQGYFERLLKVAPLLIPVLLTLVVSDVLLTVNYADIAQYRGVKLAGLITGGSGAAAGVALYAIYLLGQQRLSGAELLGQRPPDHRSSG
jgi:hypothetical protein